MSLGRRREQQRPMFVAAEEPPKSDGYPFYRKMRKLIGSGTPRERGVWSKWLLVTHQVLLAILLAVRGLARRIADRMRGSASTTTLCSWIRTFSALS